MKACLDAEPRAFCALGAQQSAQAIQGVAPLVYAGRTCTYRLYQGMSEMNGHQGIGNDGGSSIVCTGMHSMPMPRLNSTDLLPNALDTIMDTQDPDCIVVLTGCLSELVGEDVGAEVRKRKAEGWPIAFVDLPGFAGNAWEGHERFMRALVDQCVEETFEHVDGLVNLWSSVPYLNPFWTGDLLELKRLIEGLGLQVNVLFGCGSSMDAWRRIPSACLNLVVSPWVGCDLAIHLRDRFGTPYLHWPVAPVGATETRQFLEALGKTLKVPAERIQTFIAREEEVYRYHLEKGSELFIQDEPRFSQKFHCVGDAQTVLSLTHFLCGEMGLQLGAHFLVERPPARHRDALSHMFQQGRSFAATEVCFADCSLDIAPTLRAQSLTGERDLLFGSFYEKNLADELGMAFVPVSSPLGDGLTLDRTYLGYRGALRLLEDLWNAVL
ncbi:MAG TPA: nitrogenase component 1 [Fibrobacteraceae bacterium]|nr:nitrogenase component 1 [Fibrobacteraceae bacterium]